MGWNSWNYFHCDVSEATIRAMADAMAANGMKAAGYEYIVIDDCWQVARDENGRILADPERFPSGMKALADYVHGKGLKFGLYSDAGYKTCQERPGSYGYEAIDAQTYQEWGVDYLKYDWCHHRNLRPRETYARMGKELARLDRDIVYSICNWGWKRPWEWGGEWGHLWRTTGDIVPCYNCWTPFFFQNVLEIIDKQAEIWAHAGPGAWNDPDMLQVGNGKLSLAENRSHFSMWCMMAAPLMAGNNLADMPQDILEILTNPGAIAIDQDPLGKQARRIIDEGQHEVWRKLLSDGDVAVCFLNRSKKSWDMTMAWQKLDIHGNYRIQDVWLDEMMGSTDRPLKAVIPGHDVLLLHLEQQ